MRGSTLWLPTDLPHYPVLVLPDNRQVSALKGFEDANYIAMNLWEVVYPNTLLIALSNTFSSEVVFKVFSIFHLPAHSLIRLIRNQESF
ncbi:hypothetical protein FB451DRAFT_1064664 [Mycena latifolia]|nr:hypothetical protein FB451DRAFT_1064664 [Mycena latifolia]